MPIHPRYSQLLFHRPIQKLFETYYCYKMKRLCFILRQNNHWTVVTYNK